MLLHRKTVQSTATTVAGHTTCRYRQSLCPTIDFNLLEPTTYCTLDDYAAVLTLLTYGLQLEDNLLRVKAPKKPKK